MSQKREKIEYYGKKLYLQNIADQEGVICTTLARYYKQTGDIYMAVKLCKQFSRGQIQKIEYYGEMLPISVIAKREKIVIRTLTDCYRQVGDIYEAVSICQANIEKRKQRAEQREKEKEKNMIMYKGRKLELKEIALIEGIDLRSLTRWYKSLSEIYRAVFMSKYEQRKRNLLQLQVLPVDLYDMSVLIGIKYSNLINMLNEGMKIDEIKAKYCNPEIAGENIILDSGRCLLEFCAAEGLNISFMYRAMHTYGKTCQIAALNEGAKNKSIPTSWINEKYEPVLNKLGIKGLQSTLVVKELQEGQKSLEEALERFVIRKNGIQRQLSMDWGEALYALVRTREILGEEYQQEIQLNEDEKVFINECEEELLQMKNVIQCCEGERTGSSREGQIDKEDITH